MNIFHEYQYLSKERIEKIAEEIHEEGNFKTPFDPTFIAEELGLDTDIWKIPNENNQQIAAMLLPTQRKIVINENYDHFTEGFKQFSIAHEIGHWMLHVNFKSLAESEKLGIDFSKNPALHRHYTDTNLSSIEWQANYFASCLLMPKFKLQEVIKGRNLTNWKHLNAIADELGVSRSALKYRLQDLGWIYIPKNSKQIYLGKNYEN